MIKEFLMQANAEGYFSFTLIFFLTFFALSMAWVFRKKADAHYRSLALLPLSEEENRG